jgi:hypothetical protein
MSLKKNRKQMEGKWGMWNVEKYFEFVHIDINLYGNTNLVLTDVKKINKNQKTKSTLRNNTQAKNKYSFSYRELNRTNVVCPRDL